MIIRHGTRTVKIIIAIVAAILSVAAIFGVLWYHGLFLPRWIEWKNQSLIFEESMDVVVENRKIAVYSDGVKIWEPDKRYYTQSILSADVDKDGKDELLVLCWRIGRYGKRRPFWVKHDKMVWTQHIYIYDVNDGEITPQWMASDIKQLVLDWETLDNRYIVNYSPKGEKSTWEWISWGLERVPDAGETPTYLQEDIKILENIEDERKGADESVDESESNEEKNTSSEGSEKKINKVSVVMVGDMLLHDGVEKSCQDENGEYDYASLFENTKDVISAADIAIVNQEVIIGGRELNVSGYPAFNAPFEFADSLVENGFDVVCHATNHALDRGKRGLVSCLDYWNENYPQIGVIGIYEDEESADEVYIIEKNGIRIAILNYTYGTNGIPLPKGMPYAVSLLDREEELIEKLEYAECYADFTICCPHWGVEYQLGQNSEQERWAKLMVENGADLILGTHPHVIEPVEWIEADNGNQGLCYYSLGNYINWTSGKGNNVANRMVGIMARVTIEASTETDSMDENNSADNNVVRIADYEAIPIVSHVEHERGKVTTYLLEDYSKELADKNAIREQDSNFTYEYCKELYEKVIN